MAGWFEVDKKGLAQLLERRGQSFVVTELVQNAWDEDVTHVEVSFSRRKTDNKWLLTITDDAPEGFTDLRDAFTLFKASKKKGDAEKRGRFNLGEKLVLALASEATILTTKGQVIFNDDGRKVSTRHKRSSGTCVQLLLPTFHNKDVDEALVLLKRLIPPVGVKTYVTVNGFEPLGRAAFTIEEREPVHSFEVILPTEIDNGDGKLTRTNRKTKVEVYEAEGDDFTPAIYELGIPVVGTDDKYIVNVCQKVPLNLERDNVTPAYLRTLRTYVANETVDLFTAEDTTATWVTEALADNRIEPTVVAKIVEERFGKKVVAFDPSDPEANAIAASQGYTVLGGRTFSKDQWSNIRNAGAIQSAGKVTPSAKVLTSPDGIPPLDPSKWTADHKRIADYAKRVHRAIVLSGDVSPVECQVDFQHKMTANVNHAAYYSRGHVTFNIVALGKAWLKNVTQEQLDALLIHEFGHYYESNHLSSNYYDALCKLGARLRARSDEIGRL